MVKHPLFNEESKTLLDTDYMITVPFQPIDILFEKLNNQFKHNYIVLGVYNADYTRTVIDVFMEHLVSIDNNFTLTGDIELDIGQTNKIAERYKLREYEGLLVKLTNEEDVLLAKVLFGTI